MSAMKRAINELGRAAGGRPFVLLWQSTHPEIQHRSVQISHQSGLPSEFIRDMLEHGLRSVEDNCDEDPECED